MIDKVKTIDYWNFKPRVFKETGESLKMKVEVIMLPDSLPTNIKSLLLNVNSKLKRD